MHGQTSLIPMNRDREVQSQEDIEILFNPLLRIAKKSFYKIIGVCFSKLCSCFGRIKNNAVSAQDKMKNL